MNYVIYIQTLLNEFPDSFFYDAYFGFKNKGLKVIKFEDIDEIPVKWNHHHASIVVTFVEDTLKYFSKIDTNIFTTPKPINIPDELNSFHFLKRNIEVKTMGEFISDETIYPIFIKPKDKLKLFAGGVMSKESSKTFFSDIPLDTNIITSDYIDIISEYRASNSISSYGLEPDVYSQLLLTRWVEIMKQTIK